MDNFVYYGLLFDIYGYLLTDKAKDIFSLYYEENLTLQEIADIRCVSKSYVGSTIKNTQKKLDSFENNLKIYEVKKKINEILEIEDIKKLKEKLKELI
jgi:hypothetical protein